MTRYSSTARRRARRSPATDFADRITGGGSSDVLNGGDGDDVFVYTAAADEGFGAETVNGGNGTDDEIELAAAANFQLTFAVISGVERLDFATGGATANMLGSQLGAGAIAAVDGSVGIDTLIVSGVNVNLTNVAFTNWTEGVDVITINGNGAAANTLSGSKFNDTINGGSLNDSIFGTFGADILNGGDGNDTFHYSIGSHIQSGESINGGGGGEDNIRVTNNGVFPATLDFTGASISQVEFSILNSGTETNVTFLASQVSAGAINQLDLTGSASENLNILGAADLSGVFVNGFGVNDGITITGTAGDDVITGSSVRDIIIGGDGSDTLNGGGGDDVFVYNALTELGFGETVNGGAGVGDTLRISGSEIFDFTVKTLTAIERLEFGTGENGFQLTSAQIGGAGINTVVGDGLADDDVLEVLNSTSINLAGVTFTSWNSTDLIFLQGTNGADTITGSNQDDTIFGLLGADVLNGGDGNDRFEYVVPNFMAAGETVNGGNGGADAIVLIGGGTYTLSNLSITGVERLDFNSGVNTAILAGTQIGTGAITAVDSSGNVDTLNVNGALVDLQTLTFTDWNDNGVDIINISGTAGADILRGSLQKDVFAGGAGDDQYLVNNTSDTVTELAGGGNDRLFTFVSFTNVANVERLSLSGTANINGTGVDGQNDIIDGNGANNIIDGLTGSDNMNGGAGDDTYHVNTSADVVNEAAGGGFDTIFAQTGYTIAANVERLFLVDGGNFNANGRNGQDDFLAGNSGANIINGFSGNDVIRGGLGNDTLTGGLGLDIFQFLTAPNTALNTDVITDFNIADDTIQLDNLVYTLIGGNGALAAGLFKNLSLNAQDANDVILYDQVSGNLFHDANGLAAGGKTFFADVTNGLALTAADFVVV